MFGRGQITQAHQAIARILKVFGATVVEAGQAVEVEVHHDQRLGQRFEAFTVGVLRRAPGHLLGDAGRAGLEHLGRDRLAGHVQHPGNTGEDSDRLLDSIGLGLAAVDLVEQVLGLA